MKYIIPINSFTKNQTQIIKGIAILCIMLHNLFHYISPMTNMENEFYFNGNYIKEFWKNLVQNPFDFINIIFSYLGHYGVEIFILISGYGLAKSFDTTPQSWGNYMLKRLKKVYPLLIIGIVFYIFKTISIEYKLPNSNEWSSILYKLLLIHTFIPGEGLSLVGPWWFFGLIIQLYIFFPWLYRCIKKYGIKSFIVISLISYLTIYASLFMFKMPENIYVFQNAIGHFPEFCFGIIIAQSNQLRGNIWMFLVSIIIFTLGNFYIGFYPLTFLSVSYISVFMFIYFISCKFPLIPIKKLLLVFGQYSMVLFAIHGMFRWQYVVIAEKYQNPAMTLLLAILFLIEMMILAISAQKIYDWCLKTLKI